MSDIIASSEHVCRAETGARFTLLIVVRAPFRQERGSWACPVLLQGIDDKERQIYGAR